MNFNETEIQDSDIDNLIEAAILKKVSDIHLEIFNPFSRIRFRKDGLLFEHASWPIDTAKRVITQIKLLSKCDIAEQRLPQDGHFRYKNKIDIRVSTCPTQFGEKLVLRILAKENFERKINQLNFSRWQKKLFENAIAQPQGLILVTGPTGSGKTSTLYAAINAINTPQKNIVTIENPIEMILPNINQVQLHENINRTYPVMLKTFLRQDPDIIMVGEIRDNETAEIAIKAAQTGHLVFSTLHTNDALSAVKRLLYMNIPLHQLKNTLTLTTAQRLLRKLCPFCKKRQQISQKINQPFNLHKSTVIFESQGCTHCQNGFNGRIAIHSMLKLSDDIFDALAADDSIKLQNTLRKNHYFDLKRAALQIVKKGETSLNEMVRVLGNDA